MKIKWITLVVLFIISLDVQADKRIKLHPWKELLRPNCAGEECLDSDYKTHRKKQKQLDREQKRIEKERQKAERKAEKARKKEEKRLAKERQRENCKKNSNSGTAHSTAQCR